MQSSTFQYTGQELSPQDTAFQAAVTRLIEAAKARNIAFKPGTLDATLYEFGPYPYNVSLLTPLSDTLLDYFENPLDFEYAASLMQQTAEIDWQHIRFDQWIEAVWDYSFEINTVATSREEALGFLLFVIEE